MPLFASFILNAMRRCSANTRQGIGNGAGGARPAGHARRAFGALSLKVALFRPEFPAAPSSRGRWHVRVHAGPHCVHVLCSARAQTAPGGAPPWPCHWPPWPVFCCRRAIGVGGQTMPCTKSIKISVRLTTGATKKISPHGGVCLACTFMHPTKHATKYAR